MTQGDVIAFSLGTGEQTHQPPSGEHWKLEAAGWGEARETYNVAAYVGLTDGTNDRILVANPVSPVGVTSEYLPLIGGLTPNYGSDPGKVQSIRELRINYSYYLKTYQNKGTPTGYATGIQTK